MYNRYIPQADGSFQRERVPNAIHPDPSKQHEEDFSQESSNEPATRMKLPDPAQKQTIKNIYPKSVANRPFRANYNTNPASVSSFFKGLLPGNFDAEDLIVILLLLLISGNNQKDQNAALLTLGIYLYM